MPLFAPGLRRVIPAMLMAVGLMGYRDFADAAGLGEIQIRSRLGQPFRAEIPIFDEGSRLGPECFRLDPFPPDNDLPVLGQAQFRIQRRGDQTRLLLSSYQPQWNPALRIHLLLGCGVELRREYVVLLDTGEDAPAAARSASPRPADSVPEGNRREAAAEAARRSRLPEPAPPALSERPPGKGAEGSGGGSPMPTRSQPESALHPQVSPSAAVSRNRRRGLPAGEGGEPSLRMSMALETPVADLGEEEREALRRGFRLLMALQTMEVEVSDVLRAGIAGEAMPAAYRSPLRPEDWAAPGTSRAVGSPVAPGTGTPTPPEAGASSVATQSAPPTAPSAPPPLTPAAEVSGGVTGAGTPPVPGATDPSATTPAASTAGGSAAVGSLGVTRPLNRPSPRNDLLSRLLMPASAAGIVLLLGGIGWWLSRRWLQAHPAPAVDPLTLSDDHSVLLTEDTVWSTDSGFDLPKGRPPLRATHGLDTPTQPLPAAGSPSAKLGEVDLLLDDAVARAPAKPAAAALDPSSMGSISGALVVEHTVTSASQADDVLELADIMLAFGRSRAAAETLQEFVQDHPKEAVQPWLKLLEVYRQANLKSEFEQLARQLNKVFNVEVMEWAEVTEAGPGSKPAMSLMADGTDPERTMPLEVAPPPRPDDRPAQRKAMSLEDLPHLQARLVELWGQREACVAFLEQLLRDNRGGQRLGFPMAVVEEILLLRHIQKDLLDQARNEAGGDVPAGQS